MSRKAGQSRKYPVRHLFGTGSRSQSARKRHHNLLIEQLEHRTLLNAAPVLTPADTSPLIGTIDEDNPLVVSLTDSFINNTAATSTTITDEDAGDAVGGIALVGLTGQGAWEYSLDDGATFESVGTVSESEALLLPASAKLRYTPDGQNGETPTITYRAWDQSDTTQVAGSKVDTTTNGDTTTFSTATDTAKLTVTDVNDAPQNILPTTAQSTNEDTALVFTSGNCIQISDVDAGTHPVQVRLNVANGIVTFSETEGVTHTGNGSSYVTLNGTVAAINQALQGMVFTPTANFNGNATITIATDDLGNTGSEESSVATNMMSITVNPVNDAPVNSVPASMVTEEDAASLIFSGANAISISDVDAGDNPVKVTLSVTDGTLTLSQTTGLTFSSGDGTADSTMTFTGKISDINAALGGLEYKPASNFYGVATLTVTTNDQGHSGGSSEGLTDTDSVAITVTSVNDAPVLNNSGDPQLTAIDDAASDNTGNTVQQILDSVTSLDVVTDADSNALTGIAIYAYSVSTSSSSATLGKWQYSLTNDDGSTGTWIDLSSDISVNSALLLRAQDRLRFVPNGSGGGTATISFRAWDQTGSTSGKQGTKVDAQASVGGTSAFSSGTETASITIAATNHAPVLNTSWSPALDAIAQDATTNTGTLVKTLIASVGTGNDMITDSDSNAAEGIAVLSVDNTNGRWQYSTDGTTFVDFTSTTGSVVSLGSAARLLASNDTTRIRFVPNSGYTGEVEAGIVFRAWDQTSGSNGGTADTSTNGGTTAFSIATENASISVGAQGSIAGRVFIDSNNNGAFDTADTPLAFVRVTLTRTDTTTGQTTWTMLTDENGEFRFEGLAAGTYSLREDQPAGLSDGNHWQVGNTSVNTSENDVFKGISLAANQSLTGYCFAESGLLPQYLSKRLLLSTAPQAGTTAWNSMIAEIRATAEERAGNSDIAALLRGESTSGTNHAPVIQPQTFSVAENSAAGTVIGTVVATDSDAGQSLSYSIVAGNASGVFSIDNTGLLKVAKSGALDFETTPSYTLTVRVTDSGSPGLSSEATIVVNLSNVNEAPTLQDMTFSVSENSTANAVVGTIAATDVDRPAQTLSYAIVSGNADGVFSLSSSGQLTVAKPALLDYETTSKYTLTVRVTDSGSPALSTEATITVNVTDGNDAPTVTNAAFTLLEHSPVGTVVGTVAATDSNSSSQTLTYAIVGGNTNEVFAINSTTGQLTVAKQNALDYETNPVYTLTIRVTDNGSPSLSGEGTITVNLADGNDPPVVSNASFTLAEHSVVGTVVGTIAATDETPTGVTLSYEIISGNTNGVFSIDSSTGTLTVANREFLDYETAAEHKFSLRVRVTDNGSPSLSEEATITINLTDSNDPPVVEDQEFDIDENSEGGTVVGTVGVQSPNAGEEFDYEIVSPDSGLPFEIDGTGRITLKADATLNFEIADEYEFTVKVSSKVDPTLADTATITILVNNLIETAPVIADKTFTVDENLALGADLGSLDASDPDEGQTLTYAIIDGGDDLPFAIDSNGHLIVAGTLDYETQATYTFTVQVTDPDNLTDTATITVNLNDLNDAPTTTGLADILVSEDAANEVVDLFAAFADLEDADTALTFEVVGNTNPALFTATTIDGTAGTLTLAFAANASGASTITVRATDSEGLYVESSFTVTIAEVNDTPTTTGLADVNVDEDAADQVIDLFAAFADIEDADTALTFEVVGNTNPALFASTVIDGTAGTLTLAFAPNVFGSSTITVRATDSEGLYVESSFTVTVAGVNDAPTTTGLADIMVSEDAANEVVDLFAAFADLEDADTALTFEVVGNTNPALFAATTIDGTAGTLTLAFAASASGTSTVTVRATDSEGLYVESSFTVTVGAVNNAPTTTGLADVNVDEDAADQVIDLFAAFADVEDADAALTFEVVGNTNPALFTSTAIDGAAGTLTLAFAANASGTSTITVRATDTAGLYVESSFTVTVAPVNDAPVVEEGQTFSVPEDSAVATVVGTVVASDVDAGQTLTYSIVEGNDDGIFAIAPTSGQVTVAVGDLLDYESINSYSLKVRATDDGAPALFDEAIITINVTDVDEAAATGDGELLAASLLSSGQASGGQNSVDSVFGEEDSWLDTE